MLRTQQQRRLLHCCCCGGYLLHLLLLRGLLLRAVLAPLAVLRLLRVCAIQCSSRWLCSCPQS